ncbi:MAG: arginase [Deltaproteobacteria bacterium]|nr:arginase [Deltaproteobacteria bacterium]
MATKSVQIIGVPLDLGANMRGANMGPSAIRIADLHQKISVLGYQPHDVGDLPVPVRDTLPVAATQERFRHQIVTACRDLEQEVHTALSADRIPIVLGGDHSIAIGTIAGVSRYFRERQQHIGLIWIDAHADCNTPESSPSGNIHGMPLSIALGHGHPDLVAIGGQGPKVRPENVALIGIRTLDGAEKDILRRSGIRYFTMREIDERGMHAVMKDAVAAATRGTAAIHLSFDIDGIDPASAPGVSTPVTGGLSYREAHLALEMIADTGMLRSMEFVELNPMTDHAHKTAQLTVELVQSALGKAIV